MPKLVTDQDIEALWRYHDEEAEKYTGMTYEEGIRDMIDWLDGNSPRPGSEEDET